MVKLTSAVHNSSCRDSQNRKMPFSDVGDRQKRGENRIRNDEIKKKRHGSKESKVAMPKDDEALQITVKEDITAQVRGEVMIGRQPTLP